MTAEVSSIEEAERSFDLSVRNVLGVYGTAEDSVKGSCVNVHCGSSEISLIMERVEQAVMVLCRAQRVREEHAAAAGHGPGEAHFWRRQPGPAPHPAQLL